MSRKTQEQTSGLKVLDWLHFNQMLTWLAFNNEEQEYLLKIINFLNQEVKKLNLDTETSEIIKHYALCVAEIYLSDFISSSANVDFETSAMMKNIEEHLNHLFSGFLIAFGEKCHELSLSLALDIANNLVQNFKYAPLNIRYRLAERVLAFEYLFAPLVFKGWLIQRNIIFCAKYSEKNTQNPNHIITRIGLLCEFELIRNYINLQKVFNNNTLKEKLDNHSSKFYLDFYLNEKNINLENKRLLIDSKHCFEDFIYSPSLSSIPVFNINNKNDNKFSINFFKKISYRWYREPLNIDINQGKFLTQQGALMIEIYKIMIDGKKAIYIEMDNKDTITDEIQKLLKEQLGFSISSRSLYNHHRKLKQDHFYKKVKAYYCILKEQKCMTPAYNEDHLYYSLLGL